MKVIKTTVLIPEDINIALKVKAAQEKATKIDIILKILRDYFAI